jgi:hypothetical protein
MSRSKNRKMADLISGGTFDDGVVAASEVAGLHSVASTGDFNELENKPTPQTAAQLLAAIKTVDGAGSGLDADLLDGQQGSYYYAASNPSGYTTYTANQSLNTNSNPTFNDVYVADQIIHSGDTNTYMQFHAADQWRVVTGGAERLEVNNSQITSTEPVHAPSFHGDGSALTGVGGSTSTGAVGTYAFLFELAANITSNGTTRAGSGLRYGNAMSLYGSNIWAGYYTVAPSGTWRCMGYTSRVNGSRNNYSMYTGTRITLWVRIS